MFIGTGTIVIIVISCLSSWSCAGAKPGTPVTVLRPAQALSARRLPCHRGAGGRETV